MSIAVMNLVWESALITSPTEKLVLMALADWSNEMGVSWPSKQRIALRSCQSYDNVKNVLRRLEGNKVLSVEVARGRGKFSKYMINLRLFREEQKGQGLPVLTASEKQAKRAEKTGKTGKENGQNGQDGSRYKEEPSEEPSGNREGPCASAREAEPSRTQTSDDASCPEGVVAEDWKQALELAGLIEGAACEEPVVDAGGTRRALGLHYVAEEWAYGIGLPEVVQGIVAGAATDERLREVLAGLRKYPDGAMPDAGVKGRGPSRIARAVRVLTSPTWRAMNRSNGSVGTG